MSFSFKTVAQENATGKLRENYDEHIADSGAVSNTTRSFSRHLGAYEGWRGLTRLEDVCASSA